MRIIYLLNAVTDKKNYHADRGDLYRKYLVLINEYESKLHGNTDEACATCCYFTCKLIGLYPGWYTYCTCLGQITNSSFPTAKWNVWFSRAIPYWHQHCRVKMPSDKYCGTKHVILWLRIVMNAICESQSTMTTAFYSANLEMATKR